MKHKNNDIVPYIFLMVVGVILVGIVIYYVVNSVRSTTDLAGKVIENTEETASEYEEYDIMKYDGEEVRGSEVVNFIKKHLGDYPASETAPIDVHVLTIVSGTPYTNVYTNKAHISDIKNFSSTGYYIKQTAYFNCEVIRNNNKAIIGVNFTQK